MRTLLFFSFLAFVTQSFAWGGHTDPIKRFLQSHPNESTEGGCQNFEVNFTVTHTSCGLNNGAIQFTITGGTPPYTVDIGNGPLQQTNFTNLAAGTYTAIVADNGDCEEVLMITVNPSTPITVTTSVMNTTCGLNNGSATANPSGGSGYSYAWSNGGNTQTISNLAPGTYTVTVTATGNCTATATATVAASTPISVTTSVVNTTCGLNNGSATANPSGGSGYTYAWSNGGNTQTISNLAPGTYTVTVTATGNCTATATATIAVSTPISVTTSVVNTTCGLNNGSATANPSGGSGYTYAWGNGGNTQTISNLASGTYTVTVTASNGCTGTATATVGASNPITVTTSVLNTTCGLNNGSATANPSGGSGYTYAWSNGGNTQTISNLASGTYTVTVTASNGCTGTASATIGASTPVTVTTSVVNTTCGLNNGSATANPSGGSGYTYAWSNGGNTQTISNLAPGTYTVTVTATGNCTATATATVAASTPITVTTSVVNTTCGLNNGSATANPSGGSGYTYAWSNGGNTQTISNLASGTYTVTVTASNGCTGTASATVGASNPITVTTSVLNTTCGLNNGSATANPSGGSGYTYAWSNGGNTQTISNLASGTYTVTVTASNGCTGTASATIGASTPVTVTTSVVNTTCGLNNGSATANPSGGSGYTYAWSNGGNTQTISNLAPGTYTVTVTATGNCTATATATVAASSPITVTTSVVNTTCGLNNGSATANPSGGSGYTYAWSNGGNTQTISNLASGTYTVTVTANNGCTVTATATVAASTPITVTTSVVNTTCGLNNGSATANPSGGSGYTYAWSNGGNTQTISNLASGTYTVTVTASNGCTGTASATIGASTPITVTTSVVNTTCGLNNGSATANPSGGSGYTYAWSNGGNTQTISNLAPGTYTVTVTATGNCTATATATVAASTPITVTTSVVNTTCGQNNGSATANPSGGSGYTYAWSNGGNTQTISNLAPGTYTVTVTATGNCTATATATVGASSPITVTTSVVNTTCGLNNGSATANPSGGSGYTYAWSNGGNTQTINNLASGTYTVTVTANNGCTGTATATVGASTPITVTTSVVNTTCGLNNGSATANPSGGSGYTYAWSNGGNTQTISNLASGTYTVTVTANNGCTGTATATVGASTPITVTTSVVNTTCGLNNGSATANPSGGSGYTYAWSNGGNTQTISNLASGTYTVTVTANNGCTGTATATVGASTPITVTTSVVNTTCGLNNGSATANPSGGSGYTYAWSNGGNTQTISNLASGTYTVTVTASNGCTGTASATISGSTPITVTTSVVNTTCGLNNGSATANPSGGSGYTYAWSNGGNTQMISNLAPGTYTVTVTSDSGCTGTASAVVNDSDPINVSVQAVQTSCGQNNGSATANPAGGNTYTYAWSNGGTTQTISNLSPGTYTVTVTSESGCTVSGSAVVDPSGGISVTIDAISTTCGLNNGSATANPSGGSGYTYTWSNGSNTQTISNLAPGVYTVTVTATGNCTASTSVTISSSLSISASVTTEPTSCGFADGTATTLPQGGSGHTYLWSNGETTQTITNLAAGTYTVTVTDDDGCTATASGTVAASTGITASTTATPTTCSLANGTASVQAAGGSSYTYLWSNGQTTELIENLSAGTYQVTVTESNGCTATALAVVDTSTAITLTFTVQATRCQLPNGQARVEASGGVNYSYIWSNGATTQEISNLTAGMYSVTVSDENNCTATGEVLVEESSEISITLSVTNTQCGLANGQITALVQGGGSVYMYLWSNGDTTQVIENLEAGIYRVTVTSDEGCSAEAETEVAASEKLLIWELEKREVSCFGRSDGRLLVSLSGGVSPYTVLWSNGEQNTTEIDNLPAGTYTVTVTSQDSCTGTASFEISQPELLTGLLEIIPLSGNQSNDGSLIAVVSGGTAPYSYAWSNGETGFRIDNLEPGQYSVTVTDENGCTTILEAIVSPFDCDLDIEAMVTQNICFGEQQGSIRIEVIGGVMPFRFIWSNGSTTQNLEQLGAGQYVVTIIDARFCVITDTFELNDPPPIIIQEITGRMNVRPGDSEWYAVSAGPDLIFDWEVEGGEVQEQKTDSVRISWENAGVGKVRVVARSALGCFGISELEVEIGNISGTSVILPEESPVIYPNPTQDRVYIRHYPAEGIRYMVYDERGVVFRRDIFQSYIDLAGLSAGKYFIHFDKGPVFTVLKL
jgi:hypothetical protein